MLGKAVLCLTLHLYSVVAQNDCTDLRGRLISHGLHYVPGPDTCTLCVCDNGGPKACKAVLCSPPQDCRSFRVGNTCCEFICLDDVVKPADGSESSLRLAAGGAVAVALLTVALVVYRVRRQKIRRPPRADDQRSLTSIGYISGSMGYMGGTCETALAGWKPHGNYLPRGEAPPPYDEAIAQCSDGMRMNTETPFHRTYPTNLETMVRPDEAMQCTGHAYINIPRPVQQMPNPQNCFAAPLLQPHPEQREPVMHHPLVPNMVGFPSAIRLTGSLGAISHRGLSVLQREPEPERPHNVPGFYTSPANTSLHRTIPRISTAIDTTILDTSIAGFIRCDRSLHSEIRRSFHKPSERAMADTGRSMPRNLNLASSGGSRAHSEEHNVGGIEPKPLKAAGKPTADVTGPQTTLPLTVDKPSCVCSYSSGAPDGEPDGPDDYRSECENCKSATSSRWVLDPDWRDEADEGTQTLQRRAPPPAPPPPATATLPQPVTKQRPTGGPQSNWENWFNTIPDSDTESEEE
ncbi:uncharacterized protein LOC125233813 [Leguminivora glycinivorella]|uniref:uncharacterized protein LOC125233813 n=1 Tax=Leguminivora glycinivorella TaxID=1035111 RepID=UPI00200E666C|nr:uncharacterized protein LOC125233813 [Leguminivora glycinivorella]XP_047995900.1 uncharacterized protein LOC125233813 [Leguminivora glycinivorella]